MEVESLHNIEKILLDSALTKASAHSTPRKCLILQKLVSKSILAQTPLTVSIYSIF